MKLRNKKTGEMGIINHFDNQCIVIYPIDENWNAKGDKKYVYHSLAERNKEWEDYVEPKEYWHIFGTNITKTQEGFDEIFDKRNKEIGNYFETKEEAEKAVEKLKAWTRLRDKGFRFKGWSGASGSNNQLIYCDFGKADISLLNLFFGGKE